MRLFCRINGWQHFKSCWLPATKQDLRETEKRLKEAIATYASVTPPVEAAAMRVQIALDALDAAIPDRK